MPTVSSVDARVTCMSDGAVVGSPDSSTWIMRLGYIAPLAGSLSGATYNASVGRFSVCPVASGGVWSVRINISVKMSEVLAMFDSLIIACSTSCL